MPTTNYIWDPETDSCLMEADESGAGCHARIAEQGGHVMRCSAGSEISHPEARYRTPARWSTSERIA